MSRQNFGVCLLLLCMGYSDCLPAVQTQTPVTGKQCGRVQSRPHQPAISSADRATLARLSDRSRHLKSVLSPDDPEAISQKSFERAFPRSQLTRWKRLQPHFPPSTENGLNIAFLLAYYREDYARNIDRLLWPCRLWARELRMIDRVSDQEIARFERKHGLNESIVLADLSEQAMGLLTTLYDTHRDLHALQLACSLFLNGAPAEGQAESIGGYWLLRSADLMRAAAGSLGAQQNIAEVLVEYEPENPFSDSYPSLRKSIAKLRRFTHNRDRRVAAGAQGVLKQVHVSVRQAKRHE